LHAVLIPTRLQNDIIAYSFAEMAGWLWLHAEMIPTRLQNDIFAYSLLKLQGDCVCMLC
jgi:hypothetical protein